MLRIVWEMEKPENVYPQPVDMNKIVGWRGLLEGIRVPSGGGAKGKIETTVIA